MFSWIKFESTLASISIAQEFEWENVAKLLRKQFQDLPNDVQITPESCREWYSQIIAKQTNKSDANETGSEDLDDIESLLSCLSDEEENIEETDIMHSQTSSKAPQTSINSQQKNTLSQASMISKRTSTQTSMDSKQQNTLSHASIHKTQTMHQDNALTHESSETTKNSSDTFHRMSSSLDAQLDAYDESTGESYWDYTQRLLKQAHQEREQKISQVFERVIDALGGNDQSKFSTKEREKLLAQLHAHVAYNTSTKDNSRYIHGFDLDDASDSTEQYEEIQIRTKPSLPMSFPQNTSNSARSNEYQNVVHSTRSNPVDNTFNSSKSNGLHHNRRTNHSMPTTNTSSTMNEDYIFYSSSQEKDTIQSSSLADRESAFEKHQERIARRQKWLQEHRAKQEADRQELVQSIHTTIGSQVNFGLGSQLNISDDLVNGISQAHTSMLQSINTKSNPSKSTRQSNEQSFNLSKKNSVKSTKPNLDEMVLDMLTLTRNDTTNQNESMQPCNQETSSQFNTQSSTELGEVLAFLESQSHETQKEAK